MADVTISEVRIDVDLGDDGEAAFARLFQRYMRSWQAQQAEMLRQRCEMDDERMVFDRKQLR